MKIHIKTAPNWILREYAENFSKYMPDTSYSEEIDNSADINFFVNYALWEPCSTITASYFTHREFGNELANKFDEIARKSDINISMCKRTQIIVTEICPNKESYFVPPGINPIYKKKIIKIGVVGREYDSGRKRMEYARDLKHINGIELHFAGGDLPPEKMPDFYNSVDYILITAINEGGPMIAPEAIAMGKPLIMPKNVGWCDEYPGIKYSNFKELEVIVNGLAYEFDTYKSSSSMLLKIFKLHLGK
jgi:glycosyltransferase involved in cell wall biosynthesis